MDIPTSGKSNRPLIWILALMTGGAILLGTYIYKMVENPAPETDLTKLTQVAQRETLSVKIESSGTVEPIESVNISPKNQGRLVKLLVDQGMRVKRGQVLAVMENAEIQAQGYQAQARLVEAEANFKAAQVRIPGEIAQAKARLAQAQARFGQAQASLRQSQESIPRDIEQARAQLRAVESRYQLAEARVKRNQSLAEQGAITEDDFDAVVNDYLNAKASLLEAVQRLEQFKYTANPEIAQLQQDVVEAQAAVGEAQIALEQREKTAEAEIAQLGAAVQAAKGALEEVKIQFNDTVIRAPFEGIITQRYASEGAFVTPTTSASSTASATSSSILAMARGLKVVAKVPEVDLSLLQTGQPATIIADAFPNEVFKGQVVRIAPEAIIEQNVTSFEVTIALLTGQEKLLSKMNVDVNFLGQQINDALVVPTVAIVTQEGQTGVYVPDEENKPKFQAVDIGLVLDDKTQILSGLNQGERVFIDLPEQPEKKDKDQ
ncbi:efflux transporter, RND family, MFP subunit [Gloeothece citriformis PCC 7424]|uniref:Efflux transporter, RND family, MFP subunit n=1 Tax=Gloeothece citriformis (strain PCC 7424) TaxID=65393 RepID=B7KIH6_GLOC7|nr:efflux RND transporter periplasmic adaptor subunit [Gloeothece citriformis]ACK69382.1 efflux transporter, RND family, MFP subunit [Gloeothece citriformis PCC 7424]